MNIRCAIVRLPGQSQMDLFRQRRFQYSTPASQEPEGSLSCCASLVKKREVRERFEPSNPLMAGGENVHLLLISRP